jgi:hypothetical protein
MEDVSMNLVELERVQFGQPFKARVVLEVRVETFNYNYSLSNRNVLVVFARCEIND